MSAKRSFVQMSENKSLPKGKKSRPVDNGNFSSNSSEDDLFPEICEDDLFAELGGESSHNAEPACNNGDENNDDIFVEVADLCGQDDESGRVNRQHSLATEEVDSSL
jgi:hypothetical protein